MSVSCKKTITMEGLNALKLQMDGLAKKHAEHFHRVIWMDQKIKNVDEFMENLTELSDLAKLNKLLETLWLRNNSDKINKILFNNGLKNLIRTREGIIKTIINDSKKVKSENDEVFGKYVPQVYELLTVIFQNTTCNEKNLYFHTLVDYYYLQLSEKLGKLMKLNISRLLPVATFEQQIKVFLPIAKLDKMYHICADLESVEETKIRLLKPFVSEIYEYFKYPTLLREDCLKILEDHVGPYNYKIIKFELTSSETQDLYELNIWYYQEGKEQNVSLLVKQLSDSTSPISFAKEDFFYSVIVPRLAMYVSYDALSFVSKCYFVRNNDILVLDDISSDENITENLDSFTGQVIHQLAKLHSCSFILKKFNQSLEEEFLDTFADSITDDLPKHNANMLTDYILEKFPDIPLRLKLNMEEFRERNKYLFNEMFKNLKQSSNSLNVLCHGNLRKNSIVFKEDNHTGTKRCFLVNHGAIRYCPPILDLLNFLFSNTTKDFRSKTMKQLLWKYHDDLSSILQKNNLDISEVFSFGTLMKTCSSLKHTALCMSLCPMEFLEELPKKMPTAHEYNELLMKSGFSETAVKELVEELYDISQNHI